jgi:hypothetical protein
MKTLIENSFALSTNSLKKDLYKARDREPVEGTLNVIYNNKPSILDYKIEYTGGETYLEVFFNIEPQRILLSEYELTFGTRTYLTCGCGARTNALYLKLGFFACRDCQKLSYRSTTINSKSEHGKFLYQQSKRLKLMDMRESIGRIFYKSKYTKRFMRWLKLCEQSGLFKEIKSANDLIIAIDNSK